MVYRHTEEYEDARDKAYKDGLKNNEEAIEKLSLNGKEQKRHDCKLEMARIKGSIVVLWNQIVKKNRTVAIVTELFRYVLIIIFTVLFHYARYKTQGDKFILTIIVVGEILIITFSHLKPFTETADFVLGLTSLKSKMKDYYVKYGDLESKLKLADYRGLNNDPRTEILNPLEYKVEEGSDS